MDEEIGPDHQTDTGRRFQDIWLYCMLDHGIGSLPDGPCRECIALYAASGPPDGTWNKA